MDMKGCMPQEMQISQNQSRKFTEQINKQKEL